MGECLGKSIIIVCSVCTANIYLPIDLMDGEIVSCEGCGTEYEAVFVNGDVELEEIVEGEDWGE